MTRLVLHMPTAFAKAAGLVPTQKQVTRNGRTFTQTYHVRPHAPEPVPMRRKLHGFELFMPLQGDVQVERKLRFGGTETFIDRGSIRPEYHRNPELQALLSDVEYQRWHDAAQAQGAEELAARGAAERASQAAGEVERLANDAPYARNVKRIADAERNGKPIHVRFGELPDGERSWNHRDGLMEDGVSVYPAWRMARDIVYLDLRGLDHASSLFIVTGDRTPHVVTGTRVGTGSDGEPLLRDVRARRLPSDTEFTPLL